MKGRIKKFSGIISTILFSGTLTAVFIFTPTGNKVSADDSALMEAPATNSDTTTSMPESGTAQQEINGARDAMSSPSETQESKAPDATPKQKGETKKLIPKAESFVAPPNWEFDGFVAGGRDQNIKNMFAVNDLIYLTVGNEHGFASGDKLEVFRRGDHMNDPQTGRSIGYEVRKIALCEITNRIDAKVSSARVLRAYEPIEIGDLVKRAE